MAPSLPSTSPAQSSGAPRRSYGVIGGLGPLASADVFFKLMQAITVRGAADSADIVFEQHPFKGSRGHGTATTERKLYVFDLIRDFEKRGVDAIVLPCFLSHTFLDELKANTGLPIINLMEALAAHVRQHFPQARRIGVLASDYTRGSGLFERYFNALDIEIVYPQQGQPLVTDALYGAQGIKQGKLQGQALRQLEQAAHELARQGVDLILPGATEVALVAHALQGLPVPLVDANQVYADYIADSGHRQRITPFKVGVVGGVGPAATVDFMQKIVRNTPATRDQDHIKVHVEQNPQIPDRTDNLLGDGADPTIALYATCKKLEDGGADLIAIPCNTAHAYVERIQSSLGIPIVNMLTVTVESIAERYPALRRVGLLATSGTINSGVYQRALEARGLEQVVPAAAAQERVMQAIYGQHGVKAGHTQGQCQEDIRAGVADLVRQGCEVVILGCTELPLLLAEGPFRYDDTTSLELIDPTATLARRCVQLAVAASAATAS